MPPQILQRPAPQQGAQLFGAQRPKHPSAPANPAEWQRKAFVSSLTASHFVCPCYKAWSDPGTLAIEALVCGSETNKRQQKLLHSSLKVQDSILTAHPNHAIG